METERLKIHRITISIRKRKGAAEVHPSLVARPQIVLLEEIVKKMKQLKAKGEEQGEEEEMEEGAEQLSLRVTAEREVYLDFRMIQQVLHLDHLQLSQA